MDAYIRKCYVTNIVDGDTLDVEIDLGYKVFINHRVRLLAIDTPELNDKDPELKLKAYDAKHFVKAWVRGNQIGSDYPLFIRSEKIDSFGRWLGDIICSKGKSLSQDLLDAGLAVPYRK